LAYHENKARDVALCILCHTPQNSDLNTGQSLDFPAIMHKLHAGTEIDSVAAGGTFVISVDHFTSSRDYSVYEFVTQTRDCQICQVSGPTQATAWLTNPNRAACGSCHDLTNFSTGENHLNLPQIDDSQCTNCHIPKGELPLDASIQGAHTIPAYSDLLPGVVFNLLRVDNPGPNKSPTVVFTVKDKSGKPISPSEMDRLALVIAAPTTDYAGWVREDASKAKVAADGTLSYTFQKPLPANAAGTFTVGIEGRRLIQARFSAFSHRIDRTDRILAWSGSRGDRRRRSPVRGGQTDAQEHLRV
jgi:OmcA/MtrC family decaheme c-type cytochrome